VATLLAAMAQEHERAAGAWHAEWRPFSDLLCATGSAAAWLRESLEGLRVDPERMRANLDASGGLPMAEHVSAALAGAMGRSGAQEAVRRAATSGRPFADALNDDPAVRDALGRDPAGLLDPAAYLGSARAFVERALEDYAR
jgi:3-carboxy-cis,cis-muconate cycloisomerase